MGDLQHTFQDQIYFVVKSLWLIFFFVQLLLESDQFSLNWHFQSGRSQTERLQMSETNRDSANLILECVLPTERVHRVTELEE